MRHRNLYLLLTSVTLVSLVSYLYVVRLTRQKLDYISNLPSDNSARSSKVSPSGTTTSLPTSSINSKLTCDDDKCQWEKLQTSRNENLHRECARFHEKPANNLTRWLQQHRYFLHFVWFSDRHKALYCSVAKAGCTNWKKVFYLMNIMGQKDKSKEKVDLSQISDIHWFTRHSPWRLSSVKSLDEVVHRLQTYRSFVFAREPFTRVVSAFKDKFKNNGNREGWQKWTRRIHKQLNITRTSQIESLSFDDFIDYVSNPDIQSTYVGADKHWLPVAENCFPCQIRYDVIGKLETIDKDARYILEHLEVPELIDVVSERTAHQTNSSDKRYLQKYRSRLAGAQIEAFKRRYEHDYKMFGYG